MEHYLHYVFSTITAQLIRYYQYHSNISVGDVSLSDKNLSTLKLNFNWWNKSQRTLVLVELQYICS